MLASNEKLLANGSKHFNLFDESFYARRNVLTLSGLLLDMSTNALAGGFSPLVLPIGRAFQNGKADSHDTNASGIFLYVYFVRFSISIFWGFVFLDNEFKRRPQYAGRHMAWLVLWPLGLAFLGFAINQKSLTLVTLASICLGIGHGPSKYNGGVLLPSWWAVDGNQRYCQAMLGFVRGMGVILWIFFFGGVTDVLGQNRVDFVLYATAIMQGCLLFIAVLPALARAEFHQVPQFKAADDNSVISATKLESTISLLSNWRFYALICITTSVGFSTLSIKQLLAVLYQEGTQLSYLASTFYAAGSLLLYWLLSTLSPLMGTQSMVFPMYSCTLASEAFLYWVSPLAVNSQSINLFLVVRLLSGGLMAVMLINKTLLNVEVLGKESLKALKKLGSPLEVLGGSGGIVAWFMHVAALKNNEGAVGFEQRTGSFNAFFRLCSYMMLCSSGLVVILWADRSRNSCRAKETVSGVMLYQMNAN